MKRRDFIKSAIAAVIAGSTPLSLVVSLKAISTKKIEHFDSTLTGSFSEYLENKVLDHFFTVPFKELNIALCIGEPKYEIPMG